MCRAEEGNLKIQRDWGFAPDYVEGMRSSASDKRPRRRLARRHGIEPVATPLMDEGRSYRDYTLGTGRTHSVWQLIDTAFGLANNSLEWHLKGTDPVGWHARFRESGKIAVEVDGNLLRPSDPQEISVDASRAHQELGWEPRVGLEVFRDMLKDDAEQVAVV